VIRRGKGLGAARRSALAAALALGSTRGAAAQIGPLRGYLLNVAGASGSSVLSPGGASDFQRVRLMLGPALGPLHLDVAYEQIFLYQQRPGAAFTALAPGSSGASGEWLDLDWTLARRGDVLWRHRLDRLNLAVATGAFEARAGRQAISWATTLLLTPADPFAPFDPSDPFREYRSGIDAARVQYFPGPFSSLDLVVRPMQTPHGRSLIAAARGKAKLGGLDLSAWGGVAYGDPAGAVGATGTVAGAAWRTEVSVRRDSTGAAVVRGAAGLDRRWTVFGRDLYAIVEYQHDGYAAARAADLIGVLLSAPYQRGELQVLGRDVAAGELTYQVHPLVSAELLALWDLRDGSLLVAPGASLSASDNLTVRAGAYLSAGRGASLAALGSEFGAVPRFGYVSLSLFF
jgi:hypothetical protein